LCGALHLSSVTADFPWNIDVVPVPKDEEVIMTWDWSCNAMLGACGAVNQILGGTPADQKLGQIADRYQALMTRRKAA